MCLLSSGGRCCGCHKRFPVDALFSSHSLSRSLSIRLCRYPSSIGSFVGRPTFDCLPVRQKGQPFPLNRIPLSRLRAFFSPASLFRKRVRAEVRERERERLLATSLSPPQSTRNVRCVRTINKTNCSFEWPIIHSFIHPLVHS